MEEGPRPVQVSRRHGGRPSNSSGRFSLTSWRDFFKTWRRQTVLDWEKDASPGRFFSSFRPATTGLIHREKEEVKTMYQLITFQTTTLLRNSVNQSPLRRVFFLIPFVLACLALSPRAQ